MVTRLCTRIESGRTGLESYQVWPSGQFHPDHLDDLTDAVCMSITTQHHDNNLIRGFFKYAQLKL